MARLWIDRLPLQQHPSLPCYLLIKVAGRWGEPQPLGETLLFLLHTPSHCNWDKAPGSPVDVLSSPCSVQGHRDDRGQPC
jgi:hypothetical protein